MTIHILSNPISVARYKGEAGDLVIVNSSFIGNLFEKKFKRKPIVASRYRAIFIYLYFIFICKLNKKKYFHVYHEGNNYIFDLLWLIFQPVVHRTEYYGLGACESIEKERIGTSKYFRLIKLFKLVDCFEFYRSFDDAGKPEIYWFRVKDEWVAKSVEPKFDLLDVQKDEKSAIFLVGKDAVEDKELITVLHKVVKIFASYSFKIAIKDHPNPDYRLLSGTSTLDIEDVEIIEPLSLAEDFIKEYSYAVGFGSSSILSFNHPICLYGFLNHSNTDADRSH